MKTTVSDHRTKRGPKPPAEGPEGSHSTDTPVNHSKMHFASEMQHHASPSPFPSLLQYGNARHFLRKIFRETRITTNMRENHCLTRPALTQICTSHPKCSSHASPRSAISPKVISPPAFGKDAGTHTKGFTLLGKATEED